MKPSLYIFVFIFLFAMVSTLFQNITIYEEDIAHAKTEFAKKSNPKEDAKDGDGDEDAGSDNIDSDYINSDFNFNWTKFSTHTNSRFNSVNWYDCLTQGKNTPPPKI